MIHQYTPEHYYLHSLLSKSNIPVSKIAKLYRCLGTWRQVFYASIRQWRAFLKQDLQGLKKWFELRKKLDPKNDFYNLLGQKIGLIIFTDTIYPKALLDLTDPPLYFYFQGELDCLTGHCLAVVGSRKHSVEAERVLKLLLTPIIQADAILISGLAFGIDSLAHSLSLKLSKPTVAVLANGLGENSLYPAAHRGLAKQIVQQGGLLVSEYPPETKAQPQQFIARNRIIAGLAKAVVIIECGKKSGALATAKFAEQCNRSVISVPGPITTPHHEGSNQLIKEGALIATDPEDIAICLGIISKAARQADKNQMLSDSSRCVLELINKGYNNIEAMLGQSKNFSVEQILAAAADLEMRHFIKQQAGVYYII